MAARRGGKSWWVPAWATFFAAAGGAAALVTWLAVRGRPGWGAGDELATVSFVAGLVGMLTTPFAQVAVDRWFADRQARAPGAPGAPGEAVPAEWVEGWRAHLRTAVLARRVDGPRSQLGQMVRWGQVVDLPAVDRVGLGTGARGEPRIRVRGRVRPFSEVTAEWDRSRARLVVLGEPGYGKTVACLTLLAHVNGADDRPGRPVAELFPLAEWYRWGAGRPGAPLVDWLADTLAMSYPDLGLAAAVALLAQRMVIPLLDGLDEVPASHRAACKEAIDAYAGRAAPFRPFVLTSRPAEYAELAPDWVAAEHQVGLVGLEPDQVLALVDATTLGRTGWRGVRQRLQRGDRSLQELFRSPLRLSVALQEYRDGGADELAGLSPRAAQGRMWDSLLAAGGPGAGPGPRFDGAGAARVRAWLEFLAAGMRREGRQRFWLHELYLLAPDRAAETSRFKAALTVGVGLAGGLAVAVSYGLAYGARFAVLSAPVGAFVFALAYGLLVGLVGRLDVGLVGEVERPTVREDGVPFHVRFRVARRSPAVARAARYGLLYGLLGGLGYGLAILLAFWPTLGSIDGAAVLSALVAVVGLGGTLVGGLAGALGEALASGRSLVAAEPPHRLVGGGPRAALRASRDDGLRFGLAVGLVGAVVGAAMYGVVGTLVMITTGPASLLGVGACIGFVGGASVGLSAAGNAWLYYHWLRRRLARQGLLPRRLDAFLDWCAEPERAWLRVADTYEFRHRELQDHLAGGTSQTG